MADCSSSLPIIVYVDEDLDAREDFYLDAEKSKLFAPVILLEPLPQLSAMLERLSELKFDALVSDFRLADAAPLEYDGAELVDRFNEMRVGFPCFIRTSYEQEALNAADDVNTIYSKGKKSAEENRPLLERVSIQIAHHRKLAEEWSEEIAKLLELDRSTLSASQVERILELDSRLEKHLGADAGLAKLAKRSTLEAELFNVRDELMRETERLINDIRKSLDD
ncbi:MAG: hypothetical protein CML23_14265 [Rhizobiaceae bacterium]|nr:hypothetical protein [Rhizobiaceae bacterium]|tara:strand:+ start:3077 stop:3745 length:669 start_codon:yes stop_codon:yes gene_type:complete